MRRRKEDYIVIIFAIILALVVLGIAFVVFTSSRETTTPREIVLPTEVPTRTPLQEPTPTEELLPEEQQTNPPVRYDQTSSDLLLERVINREPLTDKDIQAKANILAFLNGESGYVYQTERAYIEYVQSADLFIVEIRSSDIEQAKAEAVVWFQAQGVSEEGLCKYPVEFYLNYDVAEFLRGSNTLFSPLAPGCEL